MTTAISYIWGIMPLLALSAGLVARADQLFVGPGHYVTIQSAIDAAGEGDTITVDPCTYYENINFLGKAVTVSSRDPCDPCIVAATVIDGSGSTDPYAASVVTFNQGEGNDSVLTGFTITGGRGTYLVISWQGQGPRWSQCGGGIVCYNGAQPAVARNVIRANVAGHGGGIFVYGDPVNLSDPSDPPGHLQPVIKNNTFENCRAVADPGVPAPDETYPTLNHGDGGALAMFQGVDAVIRGNDVRSSHADAYGGGLHVRQWCRGMIEGNHFHHNDAMLGGGLHVTYDSEPIVRDNLVEENVAGGLGGGGIYIFGSNPIVERNLVRRNQSTLGAGIGVFQDGEPVIRNNVIAANTSGSAVVCKNTSAPTITHNTIVNNSTTAYGGAISCTNGTQPTIENNIICDNGVGYGIYVHPGSLVRVRYNDVWANQLGNYGGTLTDQTGVNGNISAGPRFVDGAEADYRLNYDSPCIAAGDPCFQPGTGELDYDGDKRLLGQYVDIGADEAWPVWNISSGWQYTTIQGAIEDACDTAVIVLTRGSHTGNGNRDIDFRGKALTVRSAEPSNPAVVAATVIDCRATAADRHRGFYFHSGERRDSIIDGLTITHAWGPYEGGAVYCVGAGPTIRNCRIIDNLARDRGAGICLRTGSDAAIENCYFAGNTFDPVGYGGGIYSYQSSPVITNCIFVDNHAVGSGRHGGAICCWDGSDALVVNCIAVGNTAGHRGGGFYAYWSSPTFINCTVVGNRALEGGGVASFSRDYIPEQVANPTLINCILRNNRAQFGPQAALINTRSVWGWGEHSEMTISYSDIQGGRDEVFVDERYTPPWPPCVLHWGTGNIDEDPCFADLGSWDDNGTPGDPNDDVYVPGNYHLRPGSACRDRGNNSDLPPDIQCDVDGEERIANDTVDMGADEFFLPVADLDKSGSVGTVDLLVIAREWLLQGQDEPADLTGDGIIDLRDLAVLAAWWQWWAPWLVF